MIDFEQYLKEIETEVKKAEAEIASKDDSILITSTHAKYLGPKNKILLNLNTLKTTSVHEVQMSKEAYSTYKDRIKELAVNKIKTLTKQSMIDG